MTILLGEVGVSPRPKVRPDPDCQHVREPGTIGVQAAAEAQRVVAWYSAAAHKLKHTYGLRPA